jgi:hypothetical protein
MKKLLEYIILVFGLLIGIISIYSIADAMIGAEDTAISGNLNSTSETKQDLSRKAPLLDFSKFHIEH